MLRLSRYAGYLAWHFSRLCGHLACSIFWTRVASYSVVLGGLRRVLCAASQMSPESVWHTQSRVLYAPRRHLACLQAPSYFPRRLRPVVPLGASSDPPHSPQQRHLACRTPLAGVPSATWRAIPADVWGTPKRCRPIPSFTSRP